MARILVIDDDDSVRKSVARVLAMEGHRVIEAKDGKEALIIVDNQPPELIITDVYMPEMDGIEFMIRLLDRASGVPVIVISGGGHMDAATVLQQAGVFGAVATFAKPFDNTKLLSAVRRFFDEPDVRPAAVAEAAPSGRKRTPIVLDGSRRTVLVLDDDASVRRTIERVLGSQGFSVIAAMDAHEANQLVDMHDGRIDLIVADLVLPGIGGYEAANRIIAKRPEARALFISGFSTRDRRQIEEAGEAFLAKPFEIPELLDRLRMLLERSSVPA